MTRVLLLLPSTTYRAPDFLKAAESLGVEVVVGSEQATPLADAMGARALELPLSDPEEAAELIVAHDAIAPLDAIVGVDDQGTVAAAAAAQRLGLRHNPPAAVAAAKDKLLMRTLLARAEVDQPQYTVLEAGSSDEEVASSAVHVGFPVVVKPTTLAASQGVIRADSAKEAVAVARRVRSIAQRAGVPPSSPLLIERFVPGPEVAVEGLLRDGLLEVLAVFDKPDPLDGPTFEETIYLTPSRLSEADQRAVTAATQAAARALGLAEGPVHAELRVTDGRASVVEIAARTIGGLCSRSLSFSTGRSLEELVIAQALGMPVGSVERGEGASGVLMIPIPRSGRFSALEGIDSALAIPGITDVQVTMTRGRHVERVPEGNRYLGFVFARSKRAREVEAALRRAQASLMVRIEPD